MRKSNKLDSDMFIEQPSMKTLEDGTKVHYSVKQSTLLYYILGHSDEARQLSELANEIIENNKPEAEKLGLDAGVYHSAQCVVKNLELCEQIVIEDIESWINAHQTNKKTPVSFDVMAALIAWVYDLSNHKILDKLAKYIIRYQIFDKNNLCLSIEKRMLKNTKTGAPLKVNPVDNLMRVYERGGINGANENKNQNPNTRRNLQQYFGEDWRVYLDDSTTYHQDLLEAYNIWKRYN